MSAGDRWYMEAQQAGYRKGKLFDPEINEIRHGLAEAFKTNGYAASDMRHLAFAAGFLHACVDTLRDRLKAKGQAEKR